MNKTSCILFLIILTMICRKPYNPPVIANTPSYLVVEGVISTGADSTIVKLSRTISLSNGATVNMVTHATLTIESNANTTYPLTEIKKGYYATPGLNLDNTKQYRLRVKTPDNQQYLSDFVPVNVSPPIDSVGFTVANTGVQIYANTHDPNNNTRYYRWDYAETWQFHTQYYSEYVTDGTQLVGRQANQFVYYCFAGDLSSTIILGSSAKLSQDVIYQNPITLVPSTSEKIESKYSILLRQYALSGDAFKFWTNLKKTTEELGSIFDAQPTEINGNIHNINNPNEPVIGYISACAIQSKRIFIDNTQLPVTWRPIYPFSCSLDSLYFKAPFDSVNQVLEYLIPLGSSSRAITPFPSVPPPPKGYIAASSQCADCTIRGVTQAPSFWQ